MATRILARTLCALVLAAPLAIVPPRALAADGGDYQATVENPNGPPMLGIEMSPVPTNVQERENLTPNQGVYVQNTFNNTAAQTMGVRPGDVVLQVNGAPIGSMSDLRNEVGLNTVGDPVEVVVQRNGQQVLLSAPLQEWPKEITKERIDPESERRFRQWQQDRLSQQRRQVDDLQDQLDEAGRGLRPAPSPAELARAAELERRLGAQPWELAWSMSHVDHDAPLAVADAPAAPADGAGAWRFSWSNRDPGAAP